MKNFALVFITLLITIRTFAASEKTVEIPTFLKTEINKVLKSNDLIGSSWKDEYLDNEKILEIISAKLPQAPNGGPQGMPAGERNNEEGRGFPGGSMPNDDRRNGAGPGGNMPDQEMTRGEMPRGEMPRGDRPGGDIKEKLIASLKEEEILSKIRVIISEIEKTTVTETKTQNSTEVANGNSAKSSNDDKVAKKDSVACLKDTDTKDKPQDSLGNIDELKKNLDIAFKKAMEDPEFKKELLKLLKEDPDFKKLVANSDSQTKPSSTEEKEKNKDKVAQTSKDSKKPSRKKDRDEDEDSDKDEDKDEDRPTKRRTSSSSDRTASNRNSNSVNFQNPAFSSSQSSGFNMNSLFNTNSNQMNMNQMNSNQMGMNQMGMNQMGMNSGMVYNAQYSTPSYSNLGYSNLGYANSNYTSTGYLSPTLGFSNASGYGQMMNSQYSTLGQNFNLGYNSTSTGQIFSNPAYSNSSLFGMFN